MLDLALLAPLPILLIAAAISDVRRFRIPNRICAGLAAAGAVAVAAAALRGDLTASAAAAQFGVALAAFAFGFGVWALGVWGGGDAKLLAATALWFDPTTAIAMVAYMLIAGFFIALGGLLLYSYRFVIWSFGPLAALPIERWKGETPYGLAIAFGALIAFHESRLVQTTLAGLGF